MKKRAALLVRVSQVTQDFDRQIKDLKSFAKEYLIEEDDIYAEKISGTLKNEDRPELMRLMKNVQEGKKKYSMIFAQEVSRIGRNPNQARETVEFFADQGIGVFIQNINQCSLNPDRSRNSIFHMIYSIMAEMAKSENDLRVMRVKSGILNKVRNGGVGVQTVLPYGYGKDEKKMLVIDQEEAEVVRSIYQMILDGYGTKQIAHTLNSNNIPTRIQKISKKGTLKMKNSNIQKNIEDLKWVDAVIYSMLINPIYKGKRRFKNELVDVPVIVSEETWEKVQLTLKQRFDSRVRDTRWLYCLSGILKCGVCGRNMYGRYKVGGTDSYYQCSSTRTKSCGNCGIGIESLESCVWQVVRDSPKVYEYLKSTDSQLVKVDKELDKLKADLDIETKRLEELDIELDRLNYMFQKSKLSTKAYDAGTSKVEKDIKRKQKDISALKSKMKSLLEMKDRLNSMDDYLSIYNIDLKDRFSIQRILSNIVDKIVVTSVKQARNNNKYIVTVFLKDSQEQETMLIVTKPRGIKPIDFMGEFGFNSVKHGKCYFHPSDSILEKEIKYDSVRKLKTKVSRVVSLLLDNHPELYDPSDFEEDLETKVFPLLVKFEEVNIIKGDM